MSSDEELSSGTMMEEDDEDSQSSSDRSEDNGDDSDDESMETRPHFDSYEEWFEAVLESDDDALPEVSRYQWLEWLETTRETVRQGRTRQAAYHDIDACVFICLITDAITRQHFFIVAGAEQDLNIRFRLSGLEEALLSLELCGIAISQEDLNAGTSALAVVFGHLPRIEYLGFLPCYPFTFPFILPIVGACKHLVNLDMDVVGDTDSEAFLTNLPALAPCLADHPSVETVRFRSVKSELLQILGTVLPSILTLHKCWLIIDNLGDDRVPTILSRTDAEALTRILTMPQLSYLYLSGFAFSGDLQVTQSICGGLRNSSITKLTLNNVSVPQCMCRATASAITEMRELLSFTFGERVHPAFWAALGQGWEDSHTIQRVDLGSYDKMLDSDDVAALFEEANFHGLRYLELHLNDWTPTWDAKFSRFVSNNPFLETIEVKLPQYFAGPLIASSALLAVVDSPECCLKEIHFRSSQHADPTWLRQLNFILGLNKQRRLRNSAFKQVCEGSIDLMDAIAGMNEDFLYEFLRRNEWSLQSRLRDYKL